MQQVFEIESPQSSGSRERTTVRCTDLIQRRSGRREVYEGYCNDKEAVVKVFLSKMHGKRHFDRELRGFQALASRHLATAEVFAHGRNDNGNHVLALEKIKDARDVETIIDSSEEPAEVLPVLKKSFEFIGKMHQAGVVHHDHHLGNFLWDGETIYVIDPAAIQICSGPVEQPASLKQLGALFTHPAQVMRNNKTALLNAYIEARGWKIDKHMLEQLDRLIEKAHQKGIRRFLKKTLRSSKYAVRIKHNSCTGIFNRSVFGGHDLPKFMAELDGLMEDGEVLKRGNTSFVGKIPFDGQDIVVKRYNHKGFWHSLRHTLKGSRARKSWLFGHRLCCFDIACAKPLAFVEQRKFGLIWQSYILNEYVEGDNMQVFVRQSGLSEDDRKNVLSKAEELLGRLVRNGLTHGDLKPVNFLVRQGEPVLIDLDSMKRHRIPLDFKRQISRMTSDFYARLDTKR